MKATPDPAEIRPAIWEFPVSLIFTAPALIRAGADSVKLPVSFSVTARQNLIWWLIP